MLKKLCGAAVVSVLMPVYAGAAIPTSNAFADGGDLQHWVILGPLPNPGMNGEARTAPGNALGLRHDFLASLGGEGDARFTDGQQVQVTLPDGITTNFTARAAQIEDVEKGLTFHTLFARPTDDQVAYAYAALQCDGDRSAWAEFGSDDGAAVWVNGSEVHRYQSAGRPVTLGEDLFPLPLKDGVNHLLVKVENGIGDWGFALRLLSQETYEQVAAKKARIAAIRRAQSAQLVLDPEYGYCLETDVFPKLSWDREKDLEAIAGELTTKVRWFDHDLNEVAAASGPGRYGAYIEATSEKGIVIRRGITVFRAHEGLAYWRSQIPVQWDGIPSLEVDKSTWTAHQDAMDAWASAMLGNQLATGRMGAMLLCALWERDEERAKDPASEVPGWWRPDVPHAEYHLKLRAKVLGTDPAQSLAEPRWLEEPAPVLLRGSEVHAGFKPGAAAAIDAVCRSWAEEAGVPFNACIARHGQVILNRGYGQVNGEATTVKSRFDIASLSKLQTGILLTQFLDQKLLDLEAPIGRFLPDLPTEGEKVMTLRMCMSHTAGTEGHGNWGGFSNPWFDNVVAMGLESYAPGIHWEYNGLSLNLAGRVMEVASGRGFVRLMNEQLYGPLGCGNVQVIDSSYGTRIAAEDLAKVAQMLINRGAYGHRRFFKPDALAYLLPVRLGDAVPTLTGPETESRYGLGCNLDFFPFREDLPEDAPEEERSLLGPMLNHGSATGSMMSTGLDNGLIVAMARRQTGPGYDAFRERLLRTVAEFLED